MAQYCRAYSMGLAPSLKAPRAETILCGHWTGEVSPGPCSESRGPWEGNRPAWCLELRLWGASAPPGPSACRRSCGPHGLAVPTDCRLSPESMATLPGVAQVPWGKVRECRHSPAREEVGGKNSRNCHPPCETQTPLEAPSPTLLPPKPWSGLILCAGQDGSSRIPQVPTPSHLPRLPEGPADCRLVPGPPIALESHAKASACAQSASQAGAAHLAPIALSSPPKSPRPFAHMLFQASEVGSQVPHPVFQHPGPAQPDAPTFPSPSQGSWATPGLARAGVCGCLRR